MITKNIILFIITIIIMFIIIRNNNEDNKDNEEDLEIKLKFKQYIHYKYKDLIHCLEELEYFRLRNEFNDSSELYQIRDYISYSSQFDNIKTNILNNLLKMVEKLCKQCGNIIHLYITEEVYYEWKSLYEI